MASLQKRRPAPLKGHFLFLYDQSCYVIEVFQNDITEIVGYYTDRGDGLEFCNPIRIENK
jgi:hypothetical protein